MSKSNKAPASKSSNATAIKSLLTELATCHESKNVKRAKQIRRALRTKHEYFISKQPAAE